MQPLDEVRKYSQTVCEQIRWKKAHGVITEELENHIYDQRDVFMQEGIGEEEATHCAIKEMGDAVSVGSQLDSIHRPKPQWILITLTLILILMGGGISSLNSIQWNAQSNFHILPFVGAVAVFFTAYFVDFSILGKYPKQCYFLIMVIGSAGLLFSSQVNGKAWFVWGDISLGLVYLSLLFPLTYSLFIYTMRNRGIIGIIFCGAGYIPYAIILLLIPTVTGFILYTFSALVLLCVAVTRGWFGGSRKRGLLLVIIPAVAATALLSYWFVFNSYRISRISAFLHPYSDPKGYQIILIRDMLSKAEFIGKGAAFEQMSTNTMFNPLYGTDLVLTALTSYYGWIVFFGVAIVFAAFSIIGFLYIAKQKSVLGVMVSLSILLTFVIQTLVYIIGNLGYGLLSVLSLPLVSYGKTALLINSMLIGFMLSVFRTGSIFKDSCKSYNKQNSFILYEDGRLIIQLRKREELYISK